MQTQIIQQIRNLITQLDRVNQELSKAKSDKRIKALLKQNAILINKRYELVKQLGLASWDEIL
jgi:hypothetical protein